MTRHILILGASGRIGRAAAAAFRRHGWAVSSFDRHGDRTLTEAASGVDVIFNGWNPPYPDWAAQVPRLTAQIVEAARATGAAVLIPGNVYVFGPNMPERIGPDTPQAAKNPLGAIRIALENAYREAGIKTVILRAGDFLDTEASGNWFDQIITAKIAKGRISYPGALDQIHAWAFLPDLAEAFVAIAERLDHLPTFTDLAFEGYTLTAQELAGAIEAALGRSLRLSQMSWLPLQVARPFWPMARHLLEMRYLWNVPHRLDGTALDALVPDLQRTPLTDAMRQALKPQIDPDQAVVGGGGSLVSGHAQ